MVLVWLVLFAVGVSHPIPTERAEGKKEKATRGGTCQKKSSKEKATTEGNRRSHSKESK